MGDPNGYKQITHVSGLVPACCPKQHWQSETGMKETEDSLETETLERVTKRKEIIK
jgi:hypothetical protein